MNYFLYFRRCFIWFFVWRTLFFLGSLFSALCYRIFVFSTKYRGKGLSLNWQFPKSSNWFRCYFLVQGFTFTLRIAFLFHIRCFLDIRCFLIIRFFLLVRIFFLAIRFFSLIRIFLLVIRLYLLIRIFLLAIRTVLGVSLLKFCLLCCLTASWFRRVGNFSAAKFGCLASS